jgi:lipid II:glycine glycyltransferase (peptidoglycan interpeptide bridge formation enzyme)
LRIYQKAEKTLTVDSNPDIDSFLYLNDMTFARQGLKTPYSDALVKQLDKSCRNRSCRKIFIASDSQNRMHAGVYLVWDHHSAYYLMSGANPELRNSGAASLCLWEAIRFASNVCSRFDFEGSMIEPVERFFRGFGARQVPYSQITKMSRRMQMIFTVRNLIKPNKI